MDFLVQKMHKICNLKDFQHQHSFAYKQSVFSQKNMSLCQEGPTNGYLAPASLHQNPTPGTRHQNPSTPDTRHLQDNSSAHQIPPPSPSTDHSPNPTPSPLHQTESTRSSGLKSGAKISLINSFFGLVFFLRK